MTGNLAGNGATREVRPSAEGEQVIEEYAAGDSSELGVPNDTRLFEQHESNVRTYCRSFPTVFVRAKGALQFDELGREFIDFFAGAGALNYGHNPSFIKRYLLEYIEADGVTHSLDMYTTAKRTFIARFADEILQPRGLRYKIQFCGPTGTNAIEAALKIARRATGRLPVYAFSGGFHGMSLGGLSITANKALRAAAGVPLPFSGFLPYPEGPHRVEDSLERIEALLDDPCSGFDRPAAVVLETVQCEGGVYVAPTPWLRGLRELCDRHEILIICDEIQVGCGRTGTFFSFERSALAPDIVTLSKSISGYGLPLALVLMRPELDTLRPGEHTGTFRGNQLSLLAASAALDLWRGRLLENEIAMKEALARSFIEKEILPLDPGLELRGLGLLFGIDVGSAGGEEMAERIARACFANGLLIERAGRHDSVLKVMPPLTIEPELLLRGLAIIRDAARSCLADRGRSGGARPSATLVERRAAPDGHEHPGSVTAKEWWHL